MYLEVIELIRDNVLSVMSESEIAINFHKSSNNKIRETFRIGIFGKFCATVTSIPNLCFSISNGSKISLFILLENSSRNK